MQFKKWTVYLITLISMVLTLAGCPGGGGGGGSSDSSSNTDPIADNQLKFTISDQVNIPYVKVTICTPNTQSVCQTIDHVLLDTGSTGLRLMKSVLNTKMLAALTAYKDGSGNQLAECMQFADGYVWGPLYKADVKLSGETASDIVIHLMDDTQYSVPGSCSYTGISENTPDTFGANGVLGLGTFEQDCGAYCEDHDLNVYYSCVGSSCSETSLEVAKQVHNPALFFATNNNGVVITTPSVGASGSASVTGSVYFGIGTQDNNQLGSAKIFTISADGLFTTDYKGTTFDQSFMDTGSNGIYFEDVEIPVCTGSLEGFYCPSSRLNLSATLSAASTSNTTGASKTISFHIANTEKLSGTNAAFSDLGGTLPATLAGMFDWGMPFFYGRTVYNAFENANTSGGVGPYVAF